MTERLKTALIILLSTVLAVLLLAFFAVTAVSEALSAEDIIFEFFRRGEEAETTLKSSEDTAISTPCQIALLQGGGKLYSPTSVGDFYNVYRLTTRITDEALGSASGMKELSEGDFLPLFINTGVLYKYDNALSAALLFPEASEGFADTDILVKTLLICLEDDNVLLVLTDTDGKHYSFSTMSDAAYLQQLCSDFDENGVISAITTTPNVAYDSILINDTFTMPSYSAISGASDSEEFDAVMTVLGMNPYLSSVYRDGESTIYMEDIHRVILHSDGHLSYSAAEEGEGLSLNIDPSIEGIEHFYAICTKSSAIVFDLWHQLSDEEVSLCYAYSEQTDDGYILYYEAYIGGCFVNTTEHSAAAVSVSNDKITGISLHPLRITADTVIDLLPFKQAAATAESGNYIAVQYEVSGGILTPVTVCVKEGER